MIAAPSSVAPPRHAFGADRPATSGSKTVPVIGMCVIWLALVYAVFQVAPTAYEITMLISIGTALLTPLFVLVVRNELDIFEPLIFANASLASMFLGRPFYDLSTGNWLHNWFATFFDARPGFDIMLLYALAGIVALQIGYLSKLPLQIVRKLPNFPRGIDPEVAIKVAIMMFLLGAVMFEEYVRQSGGFAFLLGYLTSRHVAYKAASGYLFIGPLFWPPAGLIALSIWIKTRRPAHLVLAILSLTCFFIAMLGGVGRTFTLQGILGVGLIGYVVRGKRPSLALVIPVVVIGLLYFVYDRQSRSVVSFENKNDVLSNVLENPGKSILTIWSEDDAAMCDYLSVIVSNVPSRFSYGNGSTVTDTLLRAYPRFLWPNGKKPDEHNVAIFKRLFPAIYYRFSSGLACSVIGELYEDHGVFTIVLGMFLFGAILAVPKLWLQRTSGTLPGQLLYVAMPAYTVSLMRGGIPAFFEYLAIIAIPITLVAVYSRRKLS